jgi:hypothetical protein
MARLHSLRTLAFGAALLASLLTAPAVFAQAPPTAASATQPRYLQAMERELRALELDPLCSSESAAHGRCEVRVGTAGTGFALQLVYSDETDTIYAYVPALLVALPDAASTPALLRRLAELNWELLLGKLEWNAASGEVRLSMVLNTDSNLDRRAFRSMVRNLARLAERLGPELRRISAPAPSTPAVRPPPTPPSAT